MGYKIPRPESQSMADLALATRPVQITSQVRNSNPLNSRGATNSVPDGIRHQPSGNASSRLRENEFPELLQSHL